MKKSFFNTFIFFSFFIAALSFSSCKVEWFGDIEQDLDEKLTNTVEFFIGDPSTNPTPAYTKKYIIGTHLTQNDLPKNGSDDLYKIRPGYKITENQWKCSNDFSGYDDVINTGTYGVVDYINVPPKEAGTVKLYLNDSDWQARDDTPYTVFFHMQNIYDDNFTEERVDKKGTTGTGYLVNQIDEYRDKVGTTLSGSTTDGEYQNASNHNDDFVIKGDGSTRVDIYLYRNTRTLTFQLLDSSLLLFPESWDECPADYSDPIITKEKIDNKYIIKCRHGYEYKKLIDDIKALKPKKDGNGFYGWLEGSFSKVCGVNENPYDFILSMEESALNKFPDKITGDKYYSPVWGPDFYKIYLKMPQMKNEEFIGEIPGIDIETDAGGKYIYLSLATSLPPPNLPSTYNADDFDFSNYSYNNSILATPISLHHDDSDNTWSAHVLSGSIADSGYLSAVWTYKNIYLDPVNGNDDNDGLSSSTAVKTVSKAENLAANNMVSSNSNSILLMNKITDTQDLDDLNGITVGSNNSVCIKRAPGVKGTLIEIPADYTKEWTYITFDGNSAIVQADSPFMVNNGNLTLKRAIIFKNIISDGSVLMGSVIYNKGKLNIGGWSGTSPLINFNYITSQKGGLFCNDASDAEIFLDYSIQFTDCIGNTGAGATALAKRANIAYIRQGKLILRDKIFTSNCVIAINKGATIQNNSTVSGSGTIASLILGDENATGTLSDFTSGYKLLTKQDVYVDVDLATNAPKFNLVDSTYDASTSTPGWKIDENGKLVYATFGGGSIIIPTEYSAIFALTFNYGSHVYGTGDHSVSPSTSVETVTELPCDIGIILDLQYQGTRKFKVSGGNIQKLSDPSSTSYDPDFTGLEVKILYNGVNTGATYNTSTGKISTGSDWPAGEYVVYISFSYCGIPHSINIPFNIQY